MGHYKKIKTPFGINNNNKILKHFAVLQLNSLKQHTWCCDFAFIIGSISAGRVRAIQAWIVYIIPSNSDWSFSNFAKRSVA